MARIWMSGFEAGSMDVFDVVSGTVGAGFGVSADQARSGTKAFYYANGGQNDINRGFMSIPGSPTEIYMRIACRFTGTHVYSGTRGVFMQIQGATGQHLTFCIHRDTYALNIYRKASEALLAASAPLMLNTWYCFEIHMVIHATFGVIQVKQDGSTIIDLTGTEETPLNTAGGTGGISAVSLGGGIGNPAGYYQGHGYFDDIAINDTTGTTNNSWPGRGGIYPMIPSGAGALTQFTPDSGDNHARVSDVPPDDDTSYVESAVLDTSDLYATAGVTPTDGTVSAVQWLARARLTDSGAGNLRRLVRHDGVNYAGDDQGLDTSYRYVSEIMEEAPDETEWTLSKVNALEIGQQVG